MGYDITGKNGCETWISSGAWPGILNLAIAKGWTPRGTVDPLYRDNPEHWAGDYIDNEGQLVIAEDAVNFAFALSQASDDEILSAWRSGEEKFTAGFVKAGVDMKVNASTVDSN